MDGSSGKHEHTRPMPYTLAPRKTRAGKSSEQASGTFKRSNATWQAQLFAQLSAHGNEQPAGALNADDSIRTDLGRLGAQQRNHGHHKTGRAEAALAAVCLGKPLLRGVEEGRTSRAFCAWGRVLHIQFNSAARRASSGMQGVSDWGGSAGREGGTAQGCATGARRHARNRCWKQHELQRGSVSCGRAPWLTRVKPKKARGLESWPCTPAPGAGRPSCCQCPPQLSRACPPPAATWVQPAGWSGRLLGRRGSKMLLHRPPRQQAAAAPATAAACYCCGTTCGWTGAMRSVLGCSTLSAAASTRHPAACQAHQRSTAQHSKAQRSTRTAYSGQRQALMERWCRAPVP